MLAWHKGNLETNKQTKKASFSPHLQSASGNNSVFAAELQVLYQVSWLLSMPLAPASAA